jgi:hypothetical protein
MASSSILNGEMLPLAVVTVEASGSADGQLPNLDGKVTAALATLGG